MYNFIKKIVMEALEFVTRIKDKQIVVPYNIQLALEGKKDKQVRVIVLIGENDESEENEAAIQNKVEEQFLKGYADSDSVYDNL
jgi:hypothetical protein